VVAQSAGAYEGKPPFDAGKTGAFLQWRQHFTISRTSGFQLNNKSGLWCKATNCSLPALELSVIIMTDAESEPVASAARMIEYYIQNGRLQRIGPPEGTVWRTCNTGDGDAFRQAGCCVHSGRPR
jgi:hypothetical protein